MKPLTQSEKEAMTATNEPIIEKRRVIRSRLANGAGLAWWWQYRVVGADGRELAGWGTPLSRCRRLAKAQTAVAS